MESVSVAIKECRIKGRGLVGQEVYRWGPWSDGLEPPRPMLNDDEYDKKLLKLGLVECIFKDW